MVFFKKLHQDARAPSKTNPNDAGYDIFAFEEVSIEPNDIKLVKTMIALDFPNDIYARVAPRSGLALRHGINVLGGVIDSGYVGSVDVILINHGKSAFKVEKHARIAQIIFTKIFHETNLTLSEADFLKKTSRNSNGFGSSGI
jgi:dUTP pyrophosphatase